MKYCVFSVFCLVALFSCSKHNEPDNHIVQPNGVFALSSVQINGISNTQSYYTNFYPMIKLSFSGKVNRSSINDYIILADSSHVESALSFSYSEADSTVVVEPLKALKPLMKYSLTISKALQSQDKESLKSTESIDLITTIDSTAKFPVVSDSALLTLIQRQTFRYFWDLGNSVSGMAPERASSGNTCTAGGTGFGIMGMLAAVNRNFISRTDALNRIEKIVSFLTNNCTQYHGAFSHWIDGTTGKTIPFSVYDDGGDIVETSYLMMGLLCARQYFHQSNPAEDTLRSHINALWNAVDWTWYENSQQVLYWNWSPDHYWANDVKVQGWNEALITYVLAASSTSHSIDKAVYDKGWAQSGAIKNGYAFYNITLPLGPDLGGPLFFEHYSFMGINPSGLKDNYADYETQTQNHTLINYAFCVANPNHHYGYSNQCWGLTASDIPGGYNANSPADDIGVIAPTAAISSLPYTPAQSIRAIRFFYYQLGDKLWGQYGFYDAFCLANPWFDTDYLAIDQGPEIVMIENYRSGLIWNLFMSCPEIKSGLRKLGFTF